MADACFTARATTREHVAASIKKLTLPTTDNGQYDHDAATTFIAGIHRILRETYNPGDPGNGMFKLCAAANEIASIKATSVATAKSVLDDAKAVAAAASTSSSIVPPAIDSRADAQDEADRINLINQAVIGAKEGAAEAITAKVGSDVTDAVLKTADGSDLRSIDSSKKSLQPSSKAPIARTPATSSPNSSMSSNSHLTSAKKSPPTWSSFAPKQAG